MRYQNIKSFEQSLQSTSLQQLSRIYLVSIPSSQERDLVLRKTVTFLETILQTQVERFSAEDSLSKILDALQSPSLFGGEPLVLVDGCESLKKKELDTLLEFLQKPLQSGYLLLGSGGKTTALSKLVEQRGAILDLQEEKPWEKDKRLIDSLIESASFSQKKLFPDAAMLLLTTIGKDPLALEQELAKVIAYVGDRAQIEKKDILAICSCVDEEIPWKIAEEVVWDGKIATCDAGNFVSILFALRAQLQIGLKICSLEETKVPFGDWSAYFPKVWPRTLEKRKMQALAKGKEFFQKGLDLLFQMESLSRGGSTDLVALFDWYQVQQKRRV